MNKERYELGIGKVKEIKDYKGEQIIERLKDLDPDLARYILEFLFGDFYNRPGLEFKSREIATLAALIALGNAIPLPTVMKNIFIQGIYVGSRDMFEAMNRAIALHQLHPVVDRVFPFEETQKHSAIWRAVPTSAKSLLDFNDNRTHHYL